MNCTASYDNDRDFNIFNDFLSRLNSSSHFICCSIPSSGLWVPLVGINANSDLSPVLSVDDVVMGKEIGRGAFVFSHFFVFLSESAISFQFRESVCWQLQRKRSCNKSVFIVDARRQRERSEHLLQAAFSLHCQLFRNYCIFFVLFHFSQ